MQWGYIFCTLKTVFVALLSEINKRGGSNKACSWENCLKKNKKNSMFIREFRVRKFCCPSTYVCKTRQAMFCHYKRGQEDYVRSPHNILADFLTLPTPITEGYIGDGLCSPAT